MPPPSAPREGALAQILLVEDDDGDALLVEELVHDTTPATQLLRARTLAQARSMLEGTQPPQCVLLDLHLPDAQGLDLLREVLRASPHAAVVVLTGLAEEDMGLSAVAAGAQDYLVKGLIEPSALGRAIRYAIQRRQSEQAAAVMQASRLRAEENARLERGLLPSPLLRSDTVRVTTRYDAGRTDALLGGDFFDVVESADGSVHALIGDVSGHGPDEAALGVCLRVAWRSLTMAGARGNDLMHLMEEILRAERSSAEIFATLTTLTFTPDRDVAVILQAGHPPALLITGANRAQLLQTPTGPALGILPACLASWPQTSMALPGAGALLLFTDGLFEGRTGPAGQRLGEEGLLSLVQHHAHLPAEQLLDTLIARTQALSAAYGGHIDDRALVHLEWNTQ
ncbi:fused response regulator/phosphatase [Streptomyces agglomeratus]|uniref:Fused response regulator/phosphatase n=1 Tax=Streptomyces agglomeratus TaxID=285458 RepID=A0A1E5PHX2_9ACTN|nr:fused response regulator/phosphatase [Streptomyces agglomeratus]OEJ48610.1 fused response regulator/phosphatase [Streptomyces agglomeratus]OEJ56188.1 fused response regulator/phosphatase [Streptomyces agglomeratus]OEJ63580.1 fused response regulator/phosphatase [Streptomyces agglomeratus]